MFNKLQHFLKYSFLFSGRTYMHVFISAQNISEFKNSVFSINFCLSLLGNSKTFNIKNNIHYKPFVGDCLYENRYKDNFMFNIIAYVGVYGFSRVCFYTI